MLNADASSSDSDDDAETILKRNLGKMKVQIEANEATIEELRGQLHQVVLECQEREENV